MSDEAAGLRRRHLNAMQKRALRAGQFHRFVTLYGRKAQRGVEPNDRRYDHETEALLRRLKPEELDRLLRDDED